MERWKGYYALLQYSPVPERQEFVNVGVLLCVPEMGFLRARVTDSLRRIEKLFGRQNDPGFIHDQLQALAIRLEVEKARYLDLAALENFIRLRANDLRITPLRPTLVAEPGDYVEVLFQDLVGVEPAAKRESRVQTRLQTEFARAGVAQYLQRPAPVELADYEITIKAPFAYQNGHFNLIEPLRLEKNAAEALEQAGRRAIEGGWLAEAQQDKRLVVVGDFSRHSDKFFDKVRDTMSGHQVTLYRFDHLKPLIEDIEHSARVHGLAAMIAHEASGPQAGDMHPRN